MSILTMCPSSEWYESADLDFDFDPDERPETPPEALTFDAGRVWWSASVELDDTDN